VLTFDIAGQQLNVQLLGHSCDRSGFRSLVDGTEGDVALLIQALLLLRLAQLHGGLLAPSAPGVFAEGLDVLLHVSEGLAGHL